MGGVYSFLSDPHVPETTRDEIRKAEQITLEQLFNGKDKISFIDCYGTRRFPSF